MIFFIANYVLKHVENIKTKQIFVRFDTMI